MTDITPVAPETSPDALNSEKVTSKSHASKRRSSVVPGSVGNNSALRLRRRSTRHSIPRTGFDRRFIPYENTYRMEPNSNYKADLGQLRRIATHIIETAIYGYKYDPNRVKKFSSGIAERIRNEIKHLSFSRYKTVLQILVGQKKGQDLFVASRCLWDLEWDRYLTISRENATACITVMIFLVYTE